MHESTCEYTPRLMHMLHNSGQNIDFTVAAADAAANICVVQQPELQLCCNLPHMLCWLIVAAMQAASFGAPDQGMTVALLVDKKKHTPSCVFERPQPFRSQLR